MSIRPWTALIALAFLATPALADYGSAKPDLPAPASTNPPGNPQAEGQPLTARQQAEQYYRDAYGDVVKGSKDAADGKAKNAEKKFRHALESCRSAVGLDSTYSEAWNLIGFTSRKLGDYPHSFEAYRVALRQKPDFALAREYYGEGLLETGDLAGAKQQLTWLQRIGDKAMTAELQAAIGRYEAAHPDNTAHADSTAHPDSTASTTAGK